MIKVQGLDHFVSHVNTVSRLAPRTDFEIVSRVALDSKVLVVGSARSGIPGGKLSRFGNGRGVTLNARFTVNDSHPATAILVPTPPGPWYLLERGGKEHDIGSRRAGTGGRRGQRGQRGFLGADGRNFAAVGPVHHPAFKAKRTWSAAAALAEARGSQFFQQRARQTYLKLFVG